MILKLAWRNIWRNKRRTLITIASILFAVLLSSFMEALQKGAWNNMINNVVSAYYGYAQIHKKGYWEEQSIEEAFALIPQINNLEHTIPEIKATVPRLASFALVSTGENTKGTLVIGIDPQREDQMTGLKGRLIEGEYLEPEDKAVLIASGVGDNLGLQLGDTLLMISQGYHGVNAAGKYPVKGIIKFPSPDLNKQLVYLPLKEAQWFYGADDLVTSVTLKLDKASEVPAMMASLNETLDTTAYELMDWQAMMPDLLEAKALDSAGNVIVYIILYMIIAFGIFGTILMMTKEREYEFGILLAIGMKRRLLWITVWLEVFILGLIGALAGVMVSLPVVWYFKVNPIRFSGDYAVTMEKFGFEPIFPASFNWQIFFTQAIIVMILTAILAFYPMFKIRKLKPVEAMRN